MVRYCQACQASAKSAAPAGVPSTKIEHSSESWYHAGLDIAGPYDVAPMIQRKSFTRPGEGEELISLCDLVALLVVLSRRFVYC